MVLLFRCRLFLVPPVSSIIEMILPNGIRSSDLGPFAELASRDLRASKEVKAFLRRYTFDWTNDDKLRGTVWVSIKAWGVTVYIRLRL